MSPKAPREGMEIVSYDAMHLVERASEIHGDFLGQIVTVCRLLREVVDFSIKTHVRGCLSVSQNSG